MHSEMGMYGPEAADTGESGGVSNEQTPIFVSDCIISDKSWTALTGSIETYINSNSNY